MSSTNFAAAQERVLERRRLREAEARARRAEQQRASPINPATVQRLPYPLNKLPGAGWTLWNSVKGRDGTRPAFRVGQVDAELLDEELLGLMKGQVGDALKYFGVCLDVTPWAAHTKAINSLRCARTGRMKFCSRYGRSSSNYRYGTTTRRMVLLSRVFDIRTVAVKAPFIQLRQKHKRQCTASSPSVGATHGISGGAG